MRTKPGYFSIRTSVLGNSVKEEKKLNNKLLSINFIFACIINFGLFGSFFVHLTTLPIYIIDIGGQSADVGIIIGTLSITSILVRPFIGNKIDIYGSKIFLFTSLIFITIITILYGLVENIFFLLCLRVIHGIGWGIFTTANSTFVSDIIPAGRRGEGISYWGLFSNLSMVIGPVMGIFILQHTNFFIVSFIASIMCLIALILTLFLNEESKKKYQYERTKVKILDLFKPYVSSEIMFTFLPLLIFCLIHGAVLAFIPLLALKINISNPGIFFTIYGIILIIARTFTGKLADEVGRKKIIIPGFIFSAGALLLLAFIDILTSSFNILFILMILSSVLYGFSFACIPPIIMALAIDLAPPDKRGISMAAFGMIMDLGIGAGAFVFGIILHISSFFTIFFICALINIIGIYMTHKIKYNTNPGLL